MGLLSKIIGAALALAGIGRGDEAPAPIKVSFGDVALEMFRVIPLVLGNALKHGTLTTAEQVDAFLADFDNQTGDDLGALDAFRRLPADQEELFFDGLKQALEVYAKYKLRLPGYYEETVAAAEKPEPSGN